MGNNNQLPTPAIIGATFNMEAAKNNYMKTLQYLKNVTITRDNVNEDTSKDARLIISALTKKKEEINRPFIDAQKQAVKILKDFCEPLELELARISEEKKIVATQIKAEQQKQIDEQNRINKIKTAISDFINLVAVSITNAKTDDDIVAIEKKIGSEKTKTSVYSDLISELASACDSLRPTIKQQKENVRKLQELNEREKVALETGDINTATELKATKEYYDQLIGETGLRIHEKAFEQSLSIEMVAPETMDEAPKGRTNWKWKITDIKLLSKKLPQFVSLEPVKEKIDEMLSIKRSDGSLKGKQEESYCGILFYNDIKY